MIEASRESVAVQINEELVLLYWNLGKKIRENMLKSKRATYGKQIVSTVGRQLSMEFGSGFSARNIANMIRFAEIYPDEKILHAVRTKLSWTHLRQIIYLDDPLRREFYTEMCRVERWSTRTLEKKIAGMLFERTALSKAYKPIDRSQASRDTGISIRHHLSREGDDGRTR